MSSPTRASVTRALKQMARPAGDFDAQRYFRGDHGLRFYNVGTRPMRAFAREVFNENRETWSLEDAIRFADSLMRDPYLETKSVGVEVLARYRRAYTAAVLSAAQRWLAANLSANWATTDGLCGAVIGPLLTDHPELLPRMRVWSHQRNMWLRRASIVSLIVPMRRGLALDLAYEIASELHQYDEDLIHKAVGWTLREAGKRDQARLERYLRANGPSIPRTTLRYAIERFPPAKRRELLSATRAIPQRTNRRRGT